MYLYNTYVYITCECCLDVCGLNQRESFVVIEKHFNDFAEQCWTRTSGHVENIAGHKSIAAVVSDSQFE